MGMSGWRYSWERSQLLIMPKNANHMISHVINHVIKQYIYHVVNNFLLVAGLILYTVTTGPHWPNAILDI